MNEPAESELNELEAELRGLAPAPLPPGMIRRMADAVAAAERRPRAIGWTRWFALLGVAAVALLVGLRHKFSKAPASVAVFKPVSAEAIVTAAKDEGEVVLGDGTHARRIAESVVDTVTWKNPQTNATFTLSAPREQIRIVPISYE